jgi:hypothetical protein
MAKPVLPKELHVMNLVFKLKLDPKLKHQGMYDFKSKSIVINPKAYDFGESLLHELMEAVASAMNCVNYEGDFRIHTFRHSPEFSDDTWTTFVATLLDTIRRNGLADIIFGGGNKND